MKLFIAVAAGLVIASSAQAQERPKGERPRLDAAFFERLDTNKDAVITLDEIPEERREQAARLIERLDQDSDGKVTRKEFDAGAERMRDRAAPKNARPNAPARPEPPQSDRPRPDAPPRPGDGPRPPFGGPDLFRSLDVDRDHKLSRDELAKAADTLMKFDRNQDGMLTPEEIAAGIRGSTPGEPRSDAPAARGGAGTAAMIQRVDKNGDGKLSRDELPEMLRNRFDQLDTNGDGSVTQEELGAASARFRQNRAAEGPRPPFPGPFGGPFGASPDRPPGRPVELGERRTQVADFLREHDKDIDGRVSADEFPKDRADYFKKIDANGDGFLTPDELARGLTDSPREEKQ